MALYVRDEIRRKSEHFCNFKHLYFDALAQFTHIINTLDSGLIFQSKQLLFLRDNLFGFLENDEQIIDYLYRLPQTNTQMTYTHCFNAGLLTFCFGKWCHLDNETLDQLTIAGFLFDCGLTKIDRVVLEKNGPLTPMERAYVNKHVTFSYEMIKDEKLPAVCKLILTHHEKKDGSGYPLRLYGKQINCYSTILSLADQFEALTHMRSYRRSLHPFSAIEFMDLCGFEKFSIQTASSILYRVASSYLGHEVFLSDGSIGVISKIHKDCIGRPVISTAREYLDLKTREDVNIIFM